MYNNLHDFLRHREGENFSHHQRGKKFIKYTTTNTIIFKIHQKY